MIGRIEEIVNSTVTINLDIDITEQPNLVGLHIVFDDESGRLIIAEIANVNKKVMIANIVGEIVDGNFVPGSGAKPSFKCKVRLVEMKELELLLGNQNTAFGQTNFGTSNVYEGYKINVGINDFFNTHFSILGNSGSGKSCAVASIFQKLYISSPTPPVNSHLFFFDAYGEYTNAFGSLHEKNPKLNYKTYTTNVEEAEQGNLLQIPIWLLDVDDLALLLDATTPSQLPIIEKTLKLVPILTGNSENVIRRKNDIIARAVQDILLGGEDSTKIRDQVIGVFTKFNTPSLNLNSQIVQPGYTRTLKQCLFVDKTGKMQEMELVVEFIRGYIIEEEVEIDPSELNPFYSLTDLELALDFALISEGVLKSDKVFDIANVLSVRLHSLATGENRYYFQYPNYVTREQYIYSLSHDNSGNPVQIVNFNINYVDDRTAKVMIKIISRMVFLFSSKLKPRGSQAFHVILEEAHRYVQHDSDIQLLGYNIFERISKEGRKYGVFLVLITQRPSELSDTCVSQCMNFIVLRTLHPVDLKYIREMVPSVTDEIVLTLKNLKPGNCVAFGSAFKVPTSLYIDIPNPRPLSNNVDLESVWYKEPTASVQGGAPAVTAAAASGDVNAIMTQQAQQASFSTPASGAQPAQPAQPQTQQTAATQNFVQQANATSVMSTVGNNTVSPSPVAPQPVPSS